MLKSFFFAPYGFFLGKRSEWGCGINPFFPSPFFPRFKGGGGGGGCVANWKWLPIFKHWAAQKVLFWGGLPFWPFPLLSCSQKKLKKRTKNLSSCVYIRNPLSSSFFCPSLFPGDIPPSIIAIREVRSSGGKSWLPCSHCSAWRFFFLPLVRGSVQRGGNLWWRDDDDTWIRAKKNRTDGPMDAGKNCSPFFLSFKQLVKSCCWNNL